LTVIIWQYMPVMMQDGARVTLGTGTGIFSIVPGFVLSLIAIIIGSLLTKKPSDEVLADFEKASKPLEED